MFDKSAKQDDSQPHILTSFHYIIIEQQTGANLSKPNDLPYMYRYQSGVMNMLCIRYFTIFCQ